MLKFLVFSARHLKQVLPKVEFTPLSNWEKIVSGFKTETPTVCEGRYISISFTTSATFELPLSLTFELEFFSTQTVLFIANKTQYMNGKTIKNKEEVCITVTRAQMMNSFYDRHTNDFWYSQAALLSARNGTVLAYHPQASDVQRTTFPAP